MREDMYKVIVERPRWGHGKRGWEGRSYRNSEDRPGKIGIKKGYVDTKFLNENLAPLQRWLQSQVNRPWSKVYAELSANIDSRNVVQAHIYAHIDSYVSQHLRMVDGELHYTGRSGGELRPVRDSGVWLYVHPVTGFLLENRHRKTYWQLQREARADEAAKVAAKRRVLNDTEQLHCIDGIWYHLVIAEMDTAIRKVDGVTGSERFYYPQHWDAVRHLTVSRYPDGGNGSPTSEATFGRRYVYAVSKRQLSNAELKRYKLSNEAKQNAGDSRRFAFGLRCRSGGFPSEFKFAPNHSWRDFGVDFV